MNARVRALTIGGGLLAALGLALAVSTAVDGRISASGRLSGGAMAAVAMWVLALMLGRFMRGTRAAAALSFLRWLALPAALLLAFGWYLIMNTGTKGREYRALVQSDLRELVFAEESFHYDSGRYSTDIKALGWHASSGVAAPKITLMPTGFQAVMSHTQTNGSCTVIVSRAGQATEPQPVCEPAAPSYMALALVMLGVGLVLGGLATTIARPPA